MIDTSDTFTKCSKSLTSFTYHDHRLAKQKIFIYSRWGKKSFIFFGAPRIKITFIPQTPADQGTHCPEESRGREHTEPGPGTAGPRTCRRLPPSPISARDLLDPSAPTLPPCAHHSRPSAPCFTLHSPFLSLQPKKKYVW